MLAEKKVSKEECLYCHNNGVKLHESCPFCGDELLVESKRPEPPAPRTLISGDSLNHPIAGV